MRPSTALALVRSLEQRHSLALPGLEALDARLELVELRPREYAFKQGEPSPHVYVVRTGLLKQLYSKADGSDWIKSFTGTGDMFACPRAIAHDERAGFSSVAIEPSIVERIEFRLLEQLAETSLAWQKALRLAFQSLAEIKVQRERDLLTLTPRELYASLLDSGSEWVARVPQKDLAGFLGVTPVGLNRIIKGGAEAARARSLP